MIILCQLAHVCFKMPKDRHPNIPLGCVSNEKNNYDIDFTLWLPQSTYTKSMVYFSGFHS